MSAGWHEGTVIARHEYKGLSKSSGALEDWVERERQEAAEAPRRRSTRISQRNSLHVPGAFMSDDGDDSDI